MAVKTRLEIIFSYFFLKIHSSLHRKKNQTKTKAYIGIKYALMLQTSL